MNVHRVLTTKDRQDVRPLVLPARSAGTEGLDADQLAALVTRNGLIGTALV